NRIGAGDGLMLNHQGYLAEGTGNNLFLVRDKVLRTPHPSTGILQGITRDTVMELARGTGYEVREELLTVMDIYASDEAFFTGTATEVIPMTSVDGQKVGCGTPGAVTLEMMKLFHEHTHTGVPF